MYVICDECGEKKHIYAKKLCWYCYGVKARAKRKVKITYDKHKRAIMDRARYKADTSDDLEVEQYRISLKKQRDAIRLSKQILERSRQSRA